MCGVADIENFAVAINYPQRGMMPKVYYYTDEEVGTTWPGPDADFKLDDGRLKYEVEQYPRFVWYEWPDFDVTDDPAQADVFVVRQRLIWLSVAQVFNLPYLKGNEARHVFFDLGTDAIPEAFREWPDVPALFISATLDRRMLAGTPTAVSWPWPVDDLREFVPLPDGGFQYDVVFQGQTVQAGETAMLESVKRSGLEVFLRRNPGFYGTMEWGTKEKQELRRGFLQTMAGARFSLCHRSNNRGVMRYRFYEAMSMGRVPVLLCDDCVLPFADQIDYDRCSLRLKECDAGGVGEFLKAWLAEHTDEELVRMGQYGRKMWVSWLKRECWGEIIEELVQERMGLHE
jgi:hypothetical protein